MDAVSEIYDAGSGKNLDSLEDIRHILCWIYWRTWWLRYCAMAGMFIGPARNSMLVVVIDWIYSAVAALADTRGSGIPHLYVRYPISHGEGQHHAIRGAGSQSVPGAEHASGRGQRMPIAFEVWPWSARLPHGDFRPTAYLDEISRARLFLNECIRGGCKHSQVILRPSADVKRQAGAAGRTAV